jgi:hypothetical protein
MGRDYMEYMVMNRLAGQDTWTWLNAVLLAGLLVVVIVKRELIQSPGLFRAAWFLFAASLVAPPLLISVMLEVDNGFTRGGARAMDDLFVLRLLHTSLGPLFFAGSLCALISAIMPRRFGRPQKPAQETCPLDD